MRQIHRVLVHGHFLPTATLSYVTALFYPANGPCSTHTPILQMRTYHINIIFLSTMVIVAKNWKAYDNIFEFWNKQNPILHSYTLKLLLTHYYGSADVVCSTLWRNIENKGLMTVGNDDLVDLDYQDDLDGPDVLFDLDSVSKYWNCHPWITSSTSHHNDEGSFADDWPYGISNNVDIHLGLHDNLDCMTDGTAWQSGLHDLT